MTDEQSSIVKMGHPATRASRPMPHAEELRMLVKLEDRSRDYADKAMLSAAAELDRLNEILTHPSLPRDPNPEQYKTVLHEWEKGCPVNGQDLVNALAWRGQQSAQRDHAP
jgi:hypothetical protein